MEGDGDDYERAPVLLPDDGGYFTTRAAEGHTVSLFTVCNIVFAFHVI